MGHMPIQGLPSFPKRLDLSGLRRPEVITWSIGGIVLSDFGHPVADVEVTYSDKQTGNPIMRVKTDADGRFRANLVTKEAGIRVKPYKFPYAFCPGYQDAYGDADIRFTCVQINK